MKLSELLHNEVRDKDGKELGHVFEVEADRSGPAVGDKEGKSWRVARLLVGPSSALLRLGYQRRHIRGPVGLKFLAGRLNGFVVEWSDIDEMDEDTIKLRRRSDELPGLEEDTESMDIE
jgi:sporulation protein YlmC with PRC-barrel domain